MSASEIRQQLVSGNLSAREVINAHIERIEAVNTKLNAIVVRLFDEARCEAANADARREKGEPLGPLHGVPITIKESFDIAGTPSTMGLTIRSTHRAASDAPLVQRLRAAGAIVLGKTNVPQLLMANESDNPLYGRANNPWNLNRAPGGSSGGEAAIIAAGGSAIGLGSDIGGSIRLPAHACGIHGFKPTALRLTMLGHTQLFPGQEAVIAQPGPLARTVADLSLAMNVLAAPGQELLDPSIPPVHWHDPATVRLEGLRVAMYTNNGVIEAAPALRRAVCEAAIALRERGVKVEEWQPPDVPEANRIYIGLLTADGWQSVRRVLGHSRVDSRTRGYLRSLIFPHKVIRAAARLGAIFGQHRACDISLESGATSTDRYWQLIARRTAYRTRFMEAFNRHRFDAIICPPDALPALIHGSSFYLGAALSYAALYNLLGMPAGVVAATRVRADEETERKPGLDIVERTARKVETGSTGLPVGVQVVARHWREPVALALMAALEDHFRRQPDYPTLSVQQLEKLIGA